MIKSRAYYDIYAFYCPIRLLWRDFPTFLAGQHDEGLQPPQTTTLFPGNFENDWVGNDGKVDEQGNGTNAAFLRRMYAMIYHSFFYDPSGFSGRTAQKKVEEVRDGEFDNYATFFEASARSSTFDESWHAAEEIKPTNIDVVDGKIPLDSVRVAYALDKWEKMREYYGGRYTDLLKGYGVKADWGILQEPECIGISNNDLTFKPRSSSDAENYGDRRGFFEGEYKLKIRKTFCPEHGIIAVYAVPRAEVFNNTQGAHILCTRDLNIPSLWYDPVTWQSYNSYTTPKKVIDVGAPDGSRVSMPLAEHLRKGRNEMALGYDADWSQIPAFSKSMTSNLTSGSGYLKRICKPNASDFVDNAQVINHYSEVRMAKRSPIKPAAQTTAR